MIPWLAVGALVLGSTAAFAAPDAAKRLFDEGRALAAQGKHLEACVLFEKSYELEPAVGTQLNLADCAERDGKLRKAWLLWIAAAEEFERSSDGRAKFARDRADALAPRLATVMVKVAKPKTKGLVVQIGEHQARPQRELLERVNPGTVEVIARAPCCQEFRTTVTAELGVVARVEIPRLVRVPGTAEPADEEDEPSAGTGWRTAAIVGGVATVSLVAGFLYSLGQVREAEDLASMYAVGSPQYAEVSAQGERYATLGNVFSIGAIVAATFTTVAIVKAVRAKPAASGVAWQVAPHVSPHGAGAVVGITW